MDSYNRSIITNQVPQRLSIRQEWTGADASREAIIFIPNQRTPSNPDDTDGPVSLEENDHLLFSSTVYNPDRPESQQHAMQNDVQMVVIQQREYTTRRFQLKGS